MEVDYKGFCKALGVHLRQMRKAHGISNRDIFLVHGINDGQWRRYERGGGITVESLLRIAAVFEISVGDFLNGIKDYTAGAPEPVARKVAKGAVRALNAPATAAKNAGIKRAVGTAES